MPIETQKTKYVHFMVHGSQIFNGLIIDMLNNPSLGFNPDEHLFVITQVEIYNKYSHYKNIVLDQGLLSLNMKRIKNYMSHAEYIFLHSNNLNTFHLIQLNNQELNKIVWVVWGHDLYKRLGKGIYGRIRRIVIDLLRLSYIRDRKIERFKAIGIGFKYDSIEVKRRFGNHINVVAAPYGYEPTTKADLNEILSKNNDTYEIQPYKVMIGHSAYAFLNHFEIMDKLQKFKDENIVISMVLSYGDKHYATKVSDYALKLFGQEKVEIIDKFMPMEVYNKYLMSVDACILDYTHQSALGNFYLLLYLGKKLFLNNMGILKLCTTLEAIEAYSVNEISEMSFKEFSAPISNLKRGKDFGEFYIDEENKIRMWQNTFRELK